MVVANENAASAAPADADSRSQRPAKPHEGETTMTTTITARIWWDDQDINNQGWAWTTRVDGEHDDSGPLDGLADNATDDDLIAAIRSQVLGESRNAALADDDIEIVRN
jgi:hypothetical protein